MRPQLKQGEGEKSDEPTKLAASYECLWPASVRRWSARDEVRLE